MSPLSLVPLFFILALAGPAGWALWKVYRRAHGPRGVTCPNAQHFATIELDARHAVAMHALGEDGRRIKSCSLWPQREGCGQECLKHV